MSNPECYVRRDRQFPRFARNPKPRCPVHGQMRLEASREPVSPGVSYRVPKFLSRKIWRCKNKTCHRVHAGPVAMSEFNHTNTSKESYMMYFH